jgi:hypothetical protein
MAAHNKTLSSNSYSKAPEMASQQASSILCVITKDQQSLWFPVNQASSSVVTLRFLGLPLLLPSGRRMIRHSFSHLLTDQSIFKHKISCKLSNIPKSIWLHSGGGMTLGYHQMRIRIMRAIATLGTRISCQRGCQWIQRSQRATWQGVTSLRLLKLKYIRLYSLRW